MKKSIVLLLAAVLIFSLSACAAKDDASSAVSAQSNTDTAANASKAEPVTNDTISTESKAVISTPSELQGAPEGFVAQPKGQPRPYEDEYYDVYFYLTDEAKNTYKDFSAKALSEKFGLDIEAVWARKTSGNLSDIFLKLKDSNDEKEQAAVDKLKQNADVKTAGIIARDYIYAH